MVLIGRFKGIGHNLNQKMFPLNISENFFAVRMTKHSHRFNRETGFPILRCVQKLSGHDPGQPALDGSM